MRKKKSEGEISWFNTKKVCFKTFVLEWKCSNGDARMEMLDLIAPAETEANGGGN